MSVTLTSYPFDTESVSESQWGQMAQLWRGDGVVGGALNELAVSGYSGGMNVHVESGRCWIQGYFGENPTQQTLAISPADPTNPRVDRVVLRMDLVNNRIVLDVVTGSPAGSPSAPALTRTGTVWELSLAQVAVAAGATSIAAGNVTDERNSQVFEGANTTGVCGYAYSASPHARCKSTTRPTKWPVGATLYEEDTSHVVLNTGTYSVPVWTRTGPTVFAAPTITFGTAAAQGSADTFVRTDAVLALFSDGTPPVNQAFADAATAGVINFAARRDHKHGMPSFATSAVTLSNAQGPGVATTPLRSDAVIAAFDATVPTTSALGDAAAVGAAAFAARRDHVHGRESNVHLFAYKAAAETRNNNTLADDADLKLTVPASSVWQFEFLLYALNASDTPDLKLSVTSPAGTTNLWYSIEYPDLIGGFYNPSFLYVSGFGTPTTVNLYAAAGITPVRIAGILVNASSTTFKLQWAQNATDANVTSLRAGSHLVMHRIS